jgi:hypothetical protein
MKPDERAARDAAGVGPYASDRERLVSMASLDNWHVPDSEPDIRGWELRTVSGRQLGVVQDLLIDAAGREDVMLDFDVPAENSHVCVPIRNVEIDRRARVVLMDSADFQNAASENTASAVGRAGATGSTERRAGTSRRADVDVTRAAAVDRALGDDELEPEDVVQAESDDRRRAERRRFDRMGTDI